MSNTVEATNSQFLGTENNKEVSQFDFLKNYLLGHANEFRVNENAAIVIDEKGVSILAELCGINPEVLKIVSKFNNDLVAAMLYVLTNDGYVKHVKETTTLPELLSTVYAAVGLTNISIEMQHDTTNHDVSAWVRGYSTSNDYDELVKAVESKKIISTTTTKYVDL